MRVRKDFIVFDWIGNVGMGCGTWGFEFIECKDILTNAQIHFRIR